MTYDLFRGAFLSLVLATTVAGCARWIDMMPSTAAPSSSLARSIEEQERVPLVMESFRVVQNGTPQNPSIEVERRILNQMQETRLFSSLVPLGQPQSSNGAKTVTARLVFEESVDPHSGETAWKGFLIGASMFLLSPAIELAYDYAAQATLELERWDGEVKRYEARSSGTARYNLFGATPIMINELKGQVTEACLTTLMEQLVDDTAFYLASNAPLPAAPIRTITVKARKPAIGLAVLPISTPPSP